MTTTVATMVTRIATVGLPVLALTSAAITPGEHTGPCFFWRLATRVITSSDGRSSMVHGRAGTGPRSASRGGVMDDDLRAALSDIMRTAGGKSSPNPNGYRPCWQSAAVLPN